MKKMLITTLVVALVMSFVGCARGRDNGMDQGGNNTDMGQTTMMPTADTEMTEEDLMPTATTMPQ